jgi:hypothetical protein
MNSYWTLYFLACLPLIAGAIAYYRARNRFTWHEWLFNSLLCFAIAGAFHGCAIHSSTSDTETWSGQVTEVVHHAAWTEYYEEAVYKTVHYTTTVSDGKGGRKTVHRTKRVFSHWRPCQRKHNDEFLAFTSLPDLTVRIDRTSYHEFGKRFGGEQIDYPGDRKTGSHNSRMVGGDPNDYKYRNKTNHIIPVNKQYPWKNKLKASNTLHMFPKVPEKIVLPEYPISEDPFFSARLVGSAAAMDLYAFDQMNSRVGPLKYANVIFVGLGEVDSMYGKWLEAKWLGGKQNDIVVVWGGLNKQPTWVTVFGWTDNKTVLRDIETHILMNGAVVESLPEIERLITENYKIKNWEDFDYISLPIPTGWVIGYIVFMVLSQVTLFYYYHHNDIGDSPFHARAHPGHMRDFSHTDAIGPFGSSRMPAISSVIIKTPRRPLRK